jgi:HEAT repeat protein
MVRLRRARGMKQRVVGWVLAGAWLLVAPAARAEEPAVMLREATCSLEGMLVDLRAALKTGTPEFQSYMKEMIKESSLGMPVEELQAAIARERDPAVLEALGAGLASRSSNVDDPKLVRPLLLRAMKDSDPSLRAAAVRGLRGIGSVEVLEKNADVASYAHLLQDPSPEVREAVVGNISHESEKVYFGHHAPVAEAAASLAAASQDPELAARLLREVSMEQLSPSGAKKLSQQLRSEHPGLRAAAAIALGSVPATAAAEARSSLLEQYRGERDVGVRKAILQAIARLGLASAVPTLESLRGVEPALAPEIDAWIKALKLPVQQWSLIHREKERWRK